MRKAKNFGRGADLFLDLGAFDPGQFQRKAHVFGHGQMRVKRIVLEHHGDVAFLGRKVVDHPVPDPNRARGDVLKPGETVTPPQALARKLRDVRRFEGALKGCVTAELTQGEYDSLVSLAYNVGADAVCKSTMVRLHNAGQHAEACAQFDRWNYFQGRDCRDPANRCTGLVKRRADERAQCEGTGP